jgi:hypothetical protein
MLDLGSYLLGVLQILLLAGFAWLGATTARRCLVPELTGAPSHLATSVLALAILIWSAELLGTFSAFDPLPYLVVVGALGVGCWALLRRVAEDEGGRGQLGPQRPPHPPTGPAGRSAPIPTLVALAVAAAALVKFGAEVKLKLGTGMTGFDSTWYHGPFAAGFAQSGNTWDLYFIAPQFLAWFYPANSELLHAVGMSAFNRDLLSPLLNLGWFVGCLVACWCIGRPYRVAPWSLALGAIALRVPALSDQAGEARNDIVGIFFLLAAVAIALNAGAVRTEGNDGTAAEGGWGLSTGALILAGLAAGLAAGTKLNFLPPAAVLVVGLAAVAPRGRRLSALAATGLAALAGGGYWYLRNVVHTGNPLPWFDSLGPVSLPAPEQALGGREGHSVLGYLADGSVWSDWFLPGLHDGLWVVWPLLLAASLAGLALALRGFRCSLPRNNDQKEQRSGQWDPVLAVAGLAGLAAALAWVVAPTSASGPEGMPQGFESGLRYLAPALVLGLALLPAVSPLRDRIARLALRSQLFPHAGRIYDRMGRGGREGRLQPAAVGVAFVLAVVGLGYLAQREYLRDRYTNPTFTAPGLNAAFKWATPLAGSRIATTSTRQYPLFGTDLSNWVEFVGEERPHGGFVAPSTCRAWRRLLDRGDYDYVVASRDRIEPGKPLYPQTARWTEGPGAKIVLRRPPTVVFKLNGSLDPSSCPS